MQVLEVFQDVPKSPPRTHNIRVPWLDDAGVCVPEISHEMEDPYSICDNVKGFPLGHSLLAMQEVA